MQYYTCKVCGYPKLHDEPEYADEMCPSCAFEYGYDDRDLGIPYEEWREKWIAKGIPWEADINYKPENWDPRRQLLTIGVKV